MLYNQLAEKAIFIAYIPLTLIIQYPGIFSNFFSLCFASQTFRKASFYLHVLLVFWKELGTYTVCPFVIDQDMENE